MQLVYRSLRRFSLDFSNLSNSITTEGNRNYKISNKKPIDGYITDNVDAPATVIMIHEWWGFNKSIAKTADIFANGKLRVFVPDLYRGAPAINSEEAGHKMTGLDWPAALADIRAVKEHFEQQKKKVCVMGFCMGGALSLASLSAISGWHSGAIFYGVPDLNIFKLDAIKCNAIAHFGDQDPLKGFSDIETAQKLAKDCKTHGYPIDVHIWKGVSHAFTNQDGKTFDQITRDKAFELTRKLFEKGL